MDTSVFVGEKSSTFLHRTKHLPRPRLQRQLLRLPVLRQQRCQRGVADAQLRREGRGLVRQPGPTGTGRGGVHWGNLEKCWVNHGETW